MKTKREKKEVNKFDLDKFKVAKLKNLHLVNGGAILFMEDDPATGTGTSSRCKQVDL